MVVMVPVLASACVTALMVGITVEGTLAVRRAVFSPTTAVPFLVIHLIVTVPLVVLGILFARVRGTAQYIEVAIPVPMETKAPPAKE